MAIPGLTKFNKVLSCDGGAWHPLAPGEFEKRLGGMDPDDFITDQVTPPCTPAVAEIIGVPGVSIEFWGAVDGKIYMLVEAPPNDFTDLMWLFEWVPAGEIAPSTKKNLIIGGAIIGGLLLVGGIWYVSRRKKRR